MHHPDYLEKLLAGDYDGCAAITLQLLDSGKSVREIYEGLFAPGLQEVGHLWETNRISVAREHLATAVTERLMALLAPRIFAEEHLDRAAVVSCTANELHQVGGRMVADTLEMNGWHARFLGAGTSPEDLEARIDETSPDLVALSLALPSNLPSLVRVLERLRERYPGTPVVLGGQAFRITGQDLPYRFSSVTILESLGELEAFIRNI